ncbi:MAG: OprO/OprP family phosphate-selective porin [Methylophilaceae bacterium]|uniref:OprO/OprP family phosphate-selective porin n=1 Tax=Methylovorus sp. MM2 TaxID=1848038 RepID=UPI0007E1CC26|nr:porin [Methylovorus sp. MM2]OAM52543.1 hypothetical protein A7981_03490 [Methylovorus sp. MM2]
MKSIKLRGICAAVTGALLMSFGVNAMADSTDDLLQTLISKGVLTEEEGAQLLRGRDTEKAKKKDEIKATFKDGIGFESGDKQHAISVNGRVQLDYRNFGEQDAQTADTFDVRRAFMTVKGKFYNDYDFNITADFGSTTNNSQLDEAYFGINWWDQARFRFGQFKMPFGLEQNTSDIFTDFQERSLVDSLTPGKERGAMVFGVPTKGVYYGLAASTGRGKNVNNIDTQVEGLDVIGRATVNFAEIMGIGDTVYHVGGGISRGDISPRQQTNGAALANFAASSGRTESRGLTFFTPTAFTSLADDELTRTRYGIEGAVAMGPVKFQTEWIKHNYDGKTAGNVSFDKDIKAWYASLNWMVTGESFASTYKDGNWGRIKPKSDFIHPSAGYGIGAVELSLRYSDFDGGDFATGSSPAGTGNVAANNPTGAHAWTAGAQWILNPNTRLVLNYVTTKFEDGSIAYANNQGAALGRTDEEKAITMRAQFDF